MLCGRTLERRMISLAQKGRVHTWALPSLWLPAAVLSAFFPGDKHLSFYIATFPGAWLTEITSLRGVWFSVAHILGAMAVVAVLGFIMDCLVVRKWVYVFYLPFVLCGIFILAAGWNVSEVALILCWGVYLFASFSVLWALLRRLSKSLRRTNLSGAVAAPQRRV